MRRALTLRQNLLKVFRLTRILVQFHKLQLWSQEVHIKYFLSYFVEN